jgi:hypothetical protein
MNIFENIKNIFNKIKIHMNRNTIFMIFSILILVLAIFTSLHFYNKYNELKNNPNKAIEYEVKELVYKVEKLMDLPEGELPSLLTVEDKEKLSGETFFANAENGDIAMLYAKAMKAILYRPVDNKIIEVGVYNTQIVATSSPVISEVVTKATITIRNGTTVSGLAKLVAQRIILNDNITVAFVGNALKRNYTKTLIIDMNGKNTEVANQLAEILDGEVTDLPSGEVKSTSDILIIAGKDMSN